MKIKITDIPLKCGGKLFAIGEVAETGAKKGQIPTEVAEARLAAKTAELVEADKAAAPETK